MEELKGWEGVADLGKKIVKTLNVRSNDDPLRVWMAHYISELMKNEQAAKSEKQRNSIRRECAKLILHLWSIRYQYDFSDPINSLNRNLKILVGDDPFRQPLVRCSEEAKNEQAIDGTDYEQILELITSLSKDEKQVIFAALTADMPEDVPKVGSGTDDDGGRIDEVDYTKLLKFRDVLVKKSDNPMLKDIIAAKTNSKRKNSVIKALWEISKKRRRLIKKL